MLVVMIITLGMMFAVLMLCWFRGCRLCEIHSVLGFERSKHDPKITNHKIQDPRLALGASRFG